MIDSNLREFRFPDVPKQAMDALLIRLTCLVQTWEISSCETDASYMIVSHSNTLSDLITAPRKTCVMRNASTLEEIQVFPFYPNHIS